MSLLEVLPHTTSTIYIALQLFVFKKFTQWKYILTLL